VTTDIAALIGRLRAAMDAFDPETLGDDPAEFDAWVLLKDAKDALDAAHAEPDDNEREALVRVIHEVDYYGVNAPETPPTPREYATADAIYAAGFRRSSRVPVSQDELAAFCIDDLAYNYAVTVSDNEAKSFADGLLHQFDIFPKADRNPADSEEAGA
jgi:hypothetical protein